MLNSFEYAINMEAESPQAGCVMLVGRAKPQFVSRSFPEFVRLYLRDAPELYGSD
jgi:hypothetical protein